MTAKCDQITILEYWILSHFVVLLKSDLKVAQSGLNFWAQTSTEIFSMIRSTIPRWAEVGLNQFINSKLDRFATNAD